ncbi:MAG: dTDP-glucose pyrophosphorylase [Candidatus Deianiraeaceae bacterium]|jgi:dTDP-glucose pyrophosphorylase
MNIIIPAAGLGSRFSNAGYTDPKPFIKFNGKTMLEHAIANLHIQNARYIVLLREEHIQEHSNDIEAVSQNYNIEIVPIKQVTEGACCTVLLARKFIQSATPLLIANVDQIVDGGIQSFIENAQNRKLEGSIMTFEDNDKKWSYAKLDSNGLVTQVREKEVISNYATVGIYWFSSGNLFINAAIDMIANNERVNNEFYVCPVYNYAIKGGAKIGIYNIEKSQMNGIGTPDDLNNYIKKTFASV